MPSLSQAFAGAQSLPKLKVTPLAAQPSYITRTTEVRVENSRRGAGDGVGEEV